jgi:hypothetical protein
VISALFLPCALPELIVADFVGGRFQRRSHGRVQANLRSGKISIGYELGADQRDEEQAAEKGGGRDREGRDAMPERPAEQPLIELREPFHAALKEGEQAREMACAAHV